MEFPEDAEDRVHAEMCRVVGDVVLALHALGLTVTVPLIIETMKKRNQHRIETSDEVAAATEGAIEWLSKDMSWK